LTKEKADRQSVDHCL
jgi:DNA repair ATPase RecN